MRQPGPGKLLVNIFVFASLRHRLAHVRGKKKPKSTRSSRTYVWELCVLSHAARHRVLVCAHIFGHWSTLLMQLMGLGLDWELDINSRGHDSDGHLARNASFIQVQWSEEEMQGNMEAIGRAISALKKGLAGLTFPMHARENVGGWSVKSSTVGQILEPLVKHGGASDSSDQLCASIILARDVVRK